MTIGNVWLGSMLLSTVDGSQSLATNSLVLNSVVQNAASVCDWISVANVNSAASDTVLISVSPVEGTAFSTVVYSANITGVASVFWQPLRPLFLYPGDTVVVRVTNASLTGTANATMRILM